MTSARIFGISRHRLTTDGEGVTTLVAFTGCPLRCKYCLNKQSWEPEKGRLCTPELLFEEVKIDQLYFLATHGGITFGGGEPLLQLPFIQAFRNLCGRQWQIVVETSLHVPNPEIYEAYTGKANNIVLENLQWLLQNGDPNRIKVRVPHIPEFNTDEDVANSIERLKSEGVMDIDEFHYIIR